MIIQLVVPIILELLLFIFFYKYGISIAKIIGRRVCITCYSVSLTWLILLVVKYLGVYEINKYLIAVLISQSAVGISNLSDEFIIINNIRLPQTFVKFGTILYGTFSVLIYAFVFELLGLILIIPLMFVGILSMTPTSKAPTPTLNRSKELLEKLKNCCG